MVAAAKHNSRLVLTPDNTKHLVVECACVCVYVYVCACVRYGRNERRTKSISSHDAALWKSCEQPRCERLEAAQTHSYMVSIQTDLCHTLVNIFFELYAHEGLETPQIHSAVMQRKSTRDDCRRGRHVSPETLTYALPRLDPRLSAVSGVRSHRGLRSLEL
jgi:hypothetical protein